MQHSTPDDIASVALRQYATLGFKPPPRQFTILASFVLSDPAGNLKVISIGTGSKCLPGMRLENGGNALHDSHAEVLARRGAVRWFLEEIRRVKGSNPEESAWLVERPDGKFTLRPSVLVHLYVSTLPCGDASTRHLAATQDETMATLKNSSVFPDLAAGQAARGRDNYSFDKIASWNVLGIQCALASQFLVPVYIDAIVVGEVESDMREEVRRDCQRAFYTRLSSMNDYILLGGYALHRPAIYFTFLDFKHSKKLTPEATTSCNDSVCWVASWDKAEVLINGLRRGISPKNRHNTKFWPLLSKIALFKLCQELQRLRGGTQLLDISYRDAKDSVQEYQNAKAVLRGPEGPFAGWVKSGEQYEMFTSDGQLCKSP